MRCLLIVCCLLLTSCATVPLPPSPLRDLTLPDTTTMVWVVHDDVADSSLSHRTEDKEAPPTPEEASAQPTVKQPADMITAKGVRYRVVDEWRIMVTAYNSEAGQTDDSPWRSANGRLMIPGYAANNALPFGTAFRIPELFGDQIFTVEDRMNPRHPRNYVDVWMPSVKNARQFGRRVATMEILSSPRGGNR